MKRSAIVLIMISLAIIVLTSVNSTLKFFLLGFGVVGGIVLIGLDKYRKLDE